MQKFYWPSKGCVHPGYRQSNSTEIYLSGLSDHNFPIKNTNSYAQLNNTQVNNAQLKSAHVNNTQVNNAHVNNTPAYHSRAMQVSTEGVNIADGVSSVEGSHTVVMLGGEQGDKICVNTTSRNSEHYMDRNKILEQLNNTSSAVLRQGGRVAQKLKQKNKTWNQGTLAQAEKVCGAQRQHRGRGARLSIQNVDFSSHNYENVYDEDASKVAEELQNMNLISKKPVHDNHTKPNANHRQTPRSRKKSKAPIPLHRSKSCDRIGVGATLLDNLSCMSGRASPTESLYGQDQGKDAVSPAQSLAHKLRGRLSYVNRKMNMIRSRSAERLRGVYAASGRSEVIAVDHRGVTRPAQTGTVQVYSGPVIGQARAVVDCVPSPYDRDALTFAKDDLIDIIHMNASGLWWGRCGNRVGHFKFVNVEILPARTRRRSRSRSLRRVKRKPGTVAEVMRVLHMEQHLPVFVLNGYEDLTLFKDLDDEELDYLGITEEEQREKLIAMAELLFPDDTTDTNVDKDDSDDNSSESGVADVNSDDSMHSEHSYHSRKTERGK